ncbi:MAG TPA: hypothetical protein ENH10_00005 [Bacteroidetes bacterium]|nr:hypothetical protein [Bacteroidota bacterium]HEX03528.1 hypothetical protein [Bacteroidota bacterium]
MDMLKFDITLELTSESVSDASIDSLVQQINEVVAAAIEEKQIEIPDAEIVDYAVTRDEEYELF